MKKPLNMTLTFGGKQYKFTKGQESGQPSAAVPDVTQGSGPDKMQLQDDAQKPHDSKNAEYDAAEHTNTPDEVAKANEAWNRFLFGAEDGDDPTQEPVTPSQEPAPASAPAEGDGSFEGDVTQDDGTLVADINGVHIEVSEVGSDAPASEPAANPAPADPAASADCGNPAPQVPGATGTESLEQSIESFLASFND